MPAAPGAMFSQNRTSSYAERRNKGSFSMKQEKHISDIYCNSCGGPTCLLGLDPKDKTKAHITCGSNDPECMRGAPIYVIPAGKFSHDYPCITRGVFTYQDWEYVAFRENCNRCGKPLAYHGLNSENTACVSCPRCAPGRPFTLPRFSAEHTNKGGRPRLVMTDRERKAHRREQIRMSRHYHYEKFKK
jgi:hypothetical protein